MSPRTWNPNGKVVTTKRKKKLAEDARVAAAVVDEEVANHSHLRLRKKRLKMKKETLRR
jgi:hypothetical protein